MTYWEVRATGTSGPIDAAETALRGRGRHPAWASDARARSAKKSKSYANPPRFERRCAAYKCVGSFLQYAGGERHAQNWKYRNSSRCHMPNSEIASASAGDERPRGIRPPSHQRRRLRRAAIFAVTNSRGTLGRQSAIASASATAPRADQQQALFVHQISANPSAAGCRRMRKRSCRPPLRTGRSSNCQRPSRSWRGRTPRR